MEMRGIRLQTALLQASKAALCQHFPHGTPLVAIKRANTVIARETVDLNACTKRISNSQNTHTKPVSQHSHAQISLPRALPTQTLTKAQISTVTC